MRIVAAFSAIVLHHIYIYMYTRIVYGDAEINDNIRIIVQSDLQQRFGIKHNMF